MSSRSDHVTDGITDSSVVVDGGSEGTGSDRVLQIYPRSLCDVPHANYRPSLNRHRTNSHLFTTRHFIKNILNPTCTYLTVLSFIRLQNYGLFSSKPAIHFTYHIAYQRRY